MKIRAPFQPSRKPIWVDVLLALAGFLGIAIFVIFNGQALPDAALNLQYSRAQIKQISQQKLQEFASISSDYHTVLAFSEEKMPSYFLQQTLGVEETNSRIVAEQLPIYSWNARWYKPLQKEEYLLNLSVSGEVVGYRHLIPEDASGTNIAQEDAQVLAKTFLNTQTDWQTRIWERVDASSQTLPGGRIDHTFSWKALDYSAGESELRYTVTIQGDEIGAMSYWIRVPEAFERQFASERSLAGFINTVFMVIGLLGFMLVAFISMGVFEPHYRQALVPALLGAGVSLAAYINYLPLYPISYDTTKDYTQFWLEIGFGIAVSTVITFFTVFVAWMGGQSLAKLVWPGRDPVLPRGPERWTQFSLSAWRGLMVAGIHLGYVVGFYLLTSRFLGWWIPIGQGSASNLYATPLPFLAALDAGINASLLEELLFRLVGISLVLWISKKRWIAVLVPAIFWAFAHLSYVSSPIYARGVELVIVGVFDGLLFLYFGLLVTLVSHAAYNMLIVSVGLFQSSDPYYLFSGWVIVLILLALLLPGVIAWLRRRFGYSGSGVPEFSLTLASEAEIEHLAALPIKADWHSLLADPNRSVLCLYVAERLAGLVTGFQTGEESAVLDGLYVVPAWRRLFWGSTLIHELQERYRQQGVLHFYSYLNSGEDEPLKFLKNLHWHNWVVVLKQNTTPDAANLFSNLLSNLRRKPTTKPEYELEIPRPRDF